MKLIKELNESVSYLVEENLGKGKEYFIEGVFLQSNLKNKNGRRYPSSVMEREVNRYNEEYIKKNRAFGELGHPDSPTINLERASHIIKELYRDGDNWVGKAKVLDTPYGKIVKTLIDEGAQLAVSSRGIGSVRSSRDGIAEVQDDFMLSTAADIVADPSAPDAFVEGIMESKEWVFVDGKYQAQDIERAQERIKATSSINLAEQFAFEFANFLQKIK